MSRWASVRLRWALMPSRTRIDGAVTSNGSSQCLANPHRLAAEPWLSAAFLPHASTAAWDRATGVLWTYPTA